MRRDRETVAVLRSTGPPAHPTRPMTDRDRSPPPPAASRPPTAPRPPAGAPATAPPWSMPPAALPRRPRWRRRPESRSASFTRPGRRTFPATSTTTSGAALGVARTVGRRAQPGYGNPRHRNGLPAAAGRARRGRPGHDEGDDSGQQRHHRQRQHAAGTRIQSRAADRRRQPVADEIAQRPPRVQAVRRGIRAQ